MVFTWIVPLPDHFFKLTLYIPPKIHSVCVMNIVHRTANHFLGLASSNLKCWLCITSGSKTFFISLPSKNVVFTWWWGLQDISAFEEEIITWLPCLWHQIFEIFKFTDFVICVLWLHHSHLIGIVVHSLIKYTFASMYLSICHYYSASRERCVIVKNILPL